MFLLMSSVHLMGFCMAEGSCFTACNRDVIKSHITQVRDPSNTLKPQPEICQLRCLRPQGAVYIFYKLGQILENTQLYLTKGSF